MSDCVGRASFSILMTRSLRGFFQATKGLRRGDPLSSFLLNSVREALCRMLESAMPTHIFKGFSCADDQFTISHLQFMLSCDASGAQVQNVKAVLR